MWSFICDNCKKLFYGDTDWERCPCCGKMNHSNGDLLFEDE